MDLNEAISLTEDFQGLSQPILVVWLTEVFNMYVALMDYTDLSGLPSMFAYDVALSLHKMRYLAILKYTNY